MYKIIEIEGKKMPFASNASTQRIYHDTFQRSFGDDWHVLEAAIKKAIRKGKSTIARPDATILENLIWCAAKTANPEIPNITEWLGQFEKLQSIHDASSDIIEVYYAG